MFTVEPTWHLVVLWGCFGHLNTAGWRLPLWQHATAGEIQAVMRMYFDLRGDWLQKRLLCYSILPVPSLALRVCVTWLRYRAPSGDTELFWNVKVPSKSTLNSQTEQGDTEAVESWFLQVLPACFLSRESSVSVKKASEKGENRHHCFGVTPAYDFNTSLPGTLKSSLCKDFPVPLPSSLDRCRQKQFNAGFGIFSALSQCIHALNAYNTEESSYF